MGAAIAAIRRLLDEAQQPARRAAILEAYVDIALATDDLASARTACEELAAIAERIKVPFLRALSAQAFGALLLAEGNAAGGLAELRRSWNLWCELQVPYEAARTRCMMALACRKLGDEENAISQFTAAQQTFEQLGAAVDLACLRTLLPKEVSRTAGPLTDREVEVLKLVASGLTNRRIAQKLNISEKTVARHTQQHVHETGSRLQNRGHRLRLRASSGVSSRGCVLSGFSIANWLRGNSSSCISQAMASPSP